MEHYGPVFIRIIGSIKHAVGPSADLAQQLVTADGRGHSNHHFLADLNLLEAFMQVFYLFSK
jgi:hypothetical protein